MKYSTMMLGICVGLCSSGMINNAFTLDANNVNFNDAVNSQNKTIVLADTKTYRLEIKLLELEPSLKARLNKLLSGNSRSTDVRTEDVKNEKPPKLPKLDDMENRGKKKSKKDNV